MILNENSLILIVSLIYVSVLYILSEFFVFLGKINKYINFLMMSHKIY